MAFAHSENESGLRHDLAAHLTNVARLAGSFAEKFGAAELGYWSGLWHDLGKFHPEFQAYLANPVLKRGPDHKAAGALLAAKWMEPLAFPIAGHHGGLHSAPELKAWLKEKRDATQASQAIEMARRELASFEPPAPLTLPPYLCSKCDTEFFIRMLFSALTDADFLDTEQHFAPEQSQRRGAAPELEQLWQRFKIDQEKLTGKRDDSVSRARDEVYRACLNAAEQPSGFFRLTVPTGGGKTRSAMAFALLHALRHGKQRVIFAIPYTSIIEQAVDVYRAIFGGEAVLEHHSAVVTEEDGESPSDQEVWRRLAAENWDASIVVTTTVQLFESLFSNKTSRCRKLHNLAGSVVILDEVQTLPTRLLEPILDALKQLVAHYGVTVVLCTATQPALQDSAYLKGLCNVREMVPDPARLFADLRRVTYEWPTHGETTTWEEVAAEMRTAEQALAVVNTKADALALLDALDDPEALHLSTLMCGAHRREALKRVRERLADGEPCRLVSTQVVEAGVDIDFPLVLRAIGPLDRIVQAAGRCNREGRLARGRVVVFQPQGGKLPPGEYATGTHTTAALLGASGFDFDDPEVYQRYFTLLYQGVSLDAEGIQALRQRFEFPEVGRKFRLIEDDTTPIIVRYAPEGCHTDVDELLDQFRRHPRSASRSVFRRLQPYLVNVRSRLLSTYHKDGLAAELMPGLWEWFGRYDAVRGLTPENRDPEQLVI